MIIFINGSINSGKSTVSKILSEKLGNTAVIEIDHLRYFIYWMPLDKSIPINLEGACLLIKNFNKYGLNVIIPYPLSQNNYEFVINDLKDLKNMHFMTLNPDIDEVLKKRGRDLSDKELDRIKYHYEIGINNPKFGTIIDNTKQTPEETADEILKVVNNG